MKTEYSSDSGFFICFEGTDGSGKSTIARLVYERIRSPQGRVVFLEKNRPTLGAPYAAFHMAKIREILWEYDPDAPLGLLGDSHWLHLIAAWFQAVYHSAILPLVNEGKIVIVDSWHYKYAARFALKGGEIADLSSTVFGSIPKPNRVVLLDVDPAVAAERKGNDLKASESGQLDGVAANNRREGFISYQATVRDMLFASKNDSWARIDTTLLNQEAIVLEVVSWIRRWLPEVDAWALPPELAVRI